MEKLLDVEMTWGDRLRAEERGEARGELKGERKRQTRDNTHSGVISRLMIV